MKYKCLLIFLALSYICVGQRGNVVENEVNFEDILEQKGLLYFKADTTLVTGRVIKYNRKKEAKRYVIVINGLPDKSGWIAINNQIQYIKPITRRPFFYKGSETSADWASGQTRYNINRKNMNSVNEERMRLERNYINSDSIESDTNNKESIVLKPANNSKKDGLYEEYLKNGQKILEVTFLNGKRDGIEKKWYENGFLKSKAYFLDGKKVGRFEMFHPNGQAKVSINYIDGKEDGEIMEFGENGEIMMIGSFKEGIQVGEWYYYEKGKLIHSENFD